MKSTSRYLLTESIQVVDPITGTLTRPEFLDIRERVTATSPDDRFLTVDSSMSWATIGLIQLGDARHWWAVADMSNVIDPFLELKPGQQLRMPTVPRFLFNIMAPEETQR